MSVVRWLRISIGSLRHGWLLVVESTAAATVAWLVDTRFIGHSQPFFAPAAALIVLAQVRGQRTRRAIEVLLGVAGGVLVADVVAQALGPHVTWTIFTVILLTLTFAVAIGASAVFLVQAAVSALYLVVVAPPTQVAVPLRFVDALVGGAVALVVSQLAAGRDPVAPLVRQSGQVFDELARVLEQVAAALDRQDETAARQALRLYEAELLRLTWDSAGTPPGGRAQPRTRVVTTRATLRAVGVPPHTTRGTRKRSRNRSDRNAATLANAVSAALDRSPGSDWCR